MGGTIATFPSSLSFEEFECEFEFKLEFELEFDVDDVCNGTICFCSACEKGRKGFKASCEDRAGRFCELEALCTCDCNFGVLDCKVPAATAGCD